jgi:hypothetical protein
VSRTENLGFNAGDYKTTKTISLKKRIGVHFTSYREKAAVGVRENKEMGS